MNKKRILVIDDESTFTQLLKLNLEQTGTYEVKEINRGELGLAAAKEFKPDMILLDIIMPDIDGGSIAAQIKTDMMTKNTPILFLTAVLTKPESKELGSELGGYPCLAKPVTPEEVVSSIEKYIGR